MKILFFSSTYWGHISASLGIAKDFVLHNYDCYFGFVVPPGRTITELISHIGARLCLDRCLLEKYITTNEYRKKIQIEHDIRCNIIQRLNPDLVITDGDDFGIVAARQLKKSVIKVKRSNIDERISTELAEHYKKSILTSNSSWYSYLDIPALVPHSDVFLSINVSKKAYCSPCWVDPLNDVIFDEKTYDILVVPSTAAISADYIYNLMDFLNDKHLDIACCGLSHFSDSVAYYPFGNISALFKRAKVVVNFGGHGTINRCILANTPQIIVDIGADFIKQYGRNIEQHGAGIYVNCENDLMAIQKAIDNILSKYDIYRNSVLALSNRYACLLSPTKAVLTLNVL